MKAYQTNSKDLFSAQYHLTYENKHETEQVLNIEHNVTIDQFATLDRKPIFICKYNITRYNQQKQEFSQLFDFQHSHLTQAVLEKNCNSQLKISISISNKHVRCWKNETNA